MEPDTRTLADEDIETVRQGDRGGTAALRDPDQKDADPTDDTDGDDADDTDGDDADGTDSDGDSTDA
jgi:hypothetical protein